jgi:hypothetical protein
LEPDPATRFREATLSSLIEHHLPVFVAHHCPSNYPADSCYTASDSAGARSDRRDWHTDSLDPNGATARVGESAGQSPSPGRLPLTRSPSWPPGRAQPTTLRENRSTTFSYPTAPIFLGSL